ncbi:rRNA-binding ribosome biosynthesis protein utp25 [Tulasnella sp. 427]|nr:rRNA-binding ribosome biosynthesis protein utp25 [Tulasnella sp. 427]
MSETSITTAKLLALLNVDASRPSKRRRQVVQTEATGVIKLNRKRAEVTVEETTTTTVETTTIEDEAVNEEEIENDEADDVPNDMEADDVEKWSRSHFGNKSSLLGSRTLEAIAPPGEHSRVSNSKTEIANRERFVSEFSLPEGIVDKLAEADGLGIYPPDHVQTFKGNIDDNFRAGIRVMKKVLKLFETFYGSDLIVASPLGLRLAIEREPSTDFLSSIEVLVIDQADVMTMQNWTHLQFVFEHLNYLPKDPRDTDFSRVKSWFLDGHGRHLRQNILLSSYETPQIRALFNDNFRNIAGKVRFERRWPGVEIPEGIKQNFVKFECNNGRDEADARFEYFTKEFFPSLKKSAVLSANTLLFIPSFFDFIRVRNWLKQNATVSVAFLSEESSKSEIDRSRAQFMKGQKAFLVVTERFHFFRRYRIKGILNVIFYGPPDHANFYSELLTYPFFRKDVEPSEVTCKVLFSKYDAMALERLVGTKEAAALIRGS